ncbi:MAG TPA: MarR family winged helix-turn-helix transcriptional regulator [Methyloceanibacter sp.]|nr:MarR family winged helix-turn-helix transcriptional regulator [Methyloceanibacter sp.]
MLSRGVTKIYNRALRPYGVTVSQMNILVAVAYLGEARQQRICQALHLEKSTLSRDVGRMRSQGWLEEIRGEDGRAVLLKLTSAGKTLLEKATPAWQLAQEHATALLGKREVSALSRAAATLRAKSKADRV